MPIIDCQAVLPSPIPLSTTTFPVGKWFTIIDWAGLTLEPLRYKVTVDEPEVCVEWRRYGASLAVFTSGSFVETAYLNVFPTDLALRVELRVPVQCNIHVQRLT